MNFSEYEVLVAKIAESIKSSAADLCGLTIGAGSKNKIQGASGYNHQIDVSLQDSKRMFIVECKCWEKVAGLQEVLVLASRARDVQEKFSTATVKAILVSTEGASRNAQKVAEHFGVAIEIVKSEKEFGLRIEKYIHIGVHSNAEVGSFADAEIKKNDVIIK